MWDRGTTCQQQRQNTKQRGGDNVDRCMEHRFATNISDSVVMWFVVFLLGCSINVDGQQLSSLLRGSGKTFPDDMNNKQLRHELNDNHSIVQQSFDGQEETRRLGASQLVS